MKINRTLPCSIAIAFSIVATSPWALSNSTVEHVEPGSCKSLLKPTLEPHWKKLAMNLGAEPYEILNLEPLKSRLSEDAAHKVFYTWLQGRSDPQKNFDVSWQYLFDALSSIPEIAQQESFEVMQAYFRGLTERPTMLNLYYKLIEPSSSPVSIEANIEARVIDFVRPYWKKVATALGITNEEIASIEEEQLFPDPAPYENFLMKYEDQALIEAAVMEPDVKEALESVFNTDSYARLCPPPKDIPPTDSIIEQQQ